MQWRGKERSIYLGISSSHEFLDRMLCTKIFEVQRSERKASSCSYISKKKNLRRNRKKNKTLDGSY